jgi:glycosyl transferase family 25
MLIAYINLDSRPDRRAAMEQQFARLGMTVRRISALTPAQLAPEIVAAHCSDSARAWVSPEELACALSHRLAWALMRADDVPAMVVLEDDVTVTPQLAEWLPHSAGVASGPDVLRLETRGQRLLLGPRYDHRGGVGLHRFYSYPFGAAAYVITRRAADRLCSAPHYLDHALDDLLFDPNTPKPTRLRTAQAVPALVMGTTVDDIGPDAFLHGSDLYAGRRKRHQQVEGAARTTTVAKRALRQVRRLFGHVLLGGLERLSAKWTTVPLAGPASATLPGPVSVP